VTDAAPAAQPDPAELLRSRRFLVLLVLAAIVGIVASLASWGFLELIHQIQVGVFYDGAPTWWPIPVLGVGALLCAAAIVFLPGTGGHIPAKGLNAGATEPRELAGVVAAALATIGLGLVLGPEAPLIALGGGLGLLGYRIAARDGPPEVGQIMAAAGTFAAVSLIFDSPLLAAVLLIEATGLGGPKLPLVLLPGLMAAGIGSLISIGMGSFTGLSTSAYALGALTLPDFPRPDIADVGWSLLLAVGVAVGVYLVMGIARNVVPLATRRPFLVLPAAGLLIGCLAVAFGQLTDHPANEVLFSGQDDLDSLVTSASTWTVGALALLVGLKGIAWAISLGSYRGGPTFPAMFLGVAAGMIASHLPGYELTPAVAVGMGAGVAAMLRLPLSAVMIAVFLTGKAGIGAGPLIVVGVVAAYITTLALGARRDAPAAAPAAAGVSSPAGPRPPRSGFAAQA
jgi:H+/Cl- antiporter ClcA